MQIMKYFKRINFAFDDIIILLFLYFFHQSIINLIYNLKTLTEFSSVFRSTKLGRWF